MKTTRWALILVLALGLARSGLRRRRGRTAAGGGESTAAAEVEQFPEDTTMGKIQAAGEIKIGVKYDVPPFGFKNPQNDEIEGFDVDLGRAIAEKLGVEPNFIEAISDNRIPFLQDGTVDLVLSTMTINAERDQEIDFSEPYYIARGRILVPRTPTSRASTRWPARRSARRSARRTRRRSRSRRRSRPEARRLLLGVPGAGAERRRRRGLDRRRDPHRHDHPGRHAQAHRGRAADHRALRRRHQDGDTEFKEFVDGVLEEYKSGGWAESCEKWVGHARASSRAPTMTLKEAIEATS